MMRGSIFSGSFVLSLLFSSLAAAQLPLPIPVPAPNGQRAPDDQVEGIIFEYKGTLRPTGKADEGKKEIEGKFRLEKTAIFDVSPTFRLPSKEEVKQTADKVLSGKGVDVKLPQAPQQKRLGQFKKMATNKLRLDFDDKDTLVGAMILSKEKKTDDVWVGTFTERSSGGTVIKTYVVKVRPIQD